MDFKKISLVLVFLSLVAYASYLAYNIYVHQKQLETVKAEFAELNKVNYGLFNFQLWKVKAFDVFSGHIDNFKIAPSAFNEAEAELKKYLYSIYDKYIASGIIFDQIFNDAEKNNKVNKFMLKLFKDNISSQIDALDIKGHIPQMAKQLAMELKNNEPRFKEIMQKELTTMKNYKDKYSYIDPRNENFKKWGCTDLICTNKKIIAEINNSKLQQKDRITKFCIVMLLILLTTGLTYKWMGLNNYIGIVTLCSLVLLLLGISLPMIIIDARLNSVVFNLYEKDLNFEDQVIFYQSKSILDVTENLIESKGIDLKIVGYMILCFSVIFPMLKLILGTLYMYSKKLSNNRLVKGMIFYLGKWSMADVFVVALFMAYIGFYGLFGAQLEGLERNKGGFAIETVNHTSLAPGALFFTSYCMLSIILGIIINRFSNVNKDLSPSV